MRSVFALVLAVGLCYAAGARNTGFDGKWELDKAQSTATSDIPDGLEQQIKHKGPGVLIQSRWRELNNATAPMVLLGVMVSELSLKTDGTSSTTQMGPFAASATTKEDGNNMTTNWQTTVNGQAVTGHWTRTLAEDGKSMTLNIEQTSSEGKPGSAKLVFKRR
jgi:hypothetical protein